MIVSVDQLKAHLRIDDDAEDEYLTGLLEQSEAACLAFCLRDSFDEPVPKEAVLAVMVYAGYLHANREGGDPNPLKAMTTVVHALLWPYRDLTRLI